jgi:ankyrin repeat protein
MSRLGVIINGTGFLKRLANCNADDDVLASTIIHDSILGLNTLALHEAIAFDSDSLEILDGFGMAPLHWAIALYDSESIRILLAHNANPEAPTLDGRRPLHIAATSSPTNAILLLEAGCNVNGLDSHGQSPLFAALASSTMTQLLLEAGADPNIHDDDGDSPLSNFLRSQDSKWRDGIAGILKVISLLYRFGADINHRDRQGWTPLHNAIVYAVDSLVIEQLYQLGGRLGAVTRFGWSIYHFSAQSGRLDAIEYIRGVGPRGIDPDSADNTGWSAVDFICRLKNLEVEKLHPYARKPSPSEVWAFLKLVIEARERNWGDGLFLYSKEDPCMFAKHLAGKQWVDMNEEYFSRLIRRELCGNGADSESEWETISNNSQELDDSVAKTYLYDELDDQDPPDGNVDTLRVCEARNGDQDESEWETASSSSESGKQDSTAWDHDC